MTGKLGKGLGLRTDLEFPHKIVKSQKSLGELCVKNEFIDLSPAVTGRSCVIILFKRRIWDLFPLSRQEMILFIFSFFPLFFSFFFLFFFFPFYFLLFSPFFLLFSNFFPPFFSFFLLFPFYFPPFFPPPFFLFFLFFTYFFPPFFSFFSVAAAEALAAPWC